MKLANPQFEGQTKTKLGNTDIKSFVQRACNEWLVDWFDRNPSEVKTIITKASAAARITLARSTALWAPADWMASAATAAIASVLGIAAFMV